MAEIDQFASLLLEEAKRFLEKARSDNSEGRTAHLHAALMLSFCSLEAHTNAIADELAMRDGLSMHERAVLLEQDVQLKHGIFEIGRLKIYRLEDRILFIHARFGGEPLDRTASWWTDLTTSAKLRNSLTHPKDQHDIKIIDVTRAINSIIYVIDVIYRAVYKLPFPAKNRALDSSLNF